MCTEENKQLVRRWKEEIYRNKNFGIIDQLFAPTYVGHIAGVPGTVHGREGLRQMFESYFASFEMAYSPGSCSRTATWWPPMTLTRSSTQGRSAGSLRLGRSNR